MKNYHYAKMTYYDIENMDKDNTLIVLPIGSIEQHGRHIPVDTDALQVATVAEKAVRIASEKVNILLAPIQSYGYASITMNLDQPADKYPGSITLSVETFINVITEITNSFVRAGFKRILLLNGHGGNYQLLQVAARKIRDLSGAIVAVVNYWTLPSAEEMKEAGLEEGTLRHSAEWETSMHLAIDEEHVVKSRIVADPTAIAAIKVKTEYFSRDELGGKAFAAKAYFPERNGDYSGHGVVGNAALGSREKGERFLELHVKKLVAFLQEYAKWEYGKI
jgi:creatinine amidohydrolase